MSPAGAGKANWLTILDASGARIAENAAKKFAVNTIHSNRNRGDTMYHLPSSSDFLRLANRVFIGGQIHALRCSIGRRVESYKSGRSPVEP